MAENNVIKEDVLEPKYLFMRLADIFNNGEYNVNFQNEKSKRYFFRIYKTDATEEFLYHANELKKISSVPIYKIPCYCEWCEFEYIEYKEESEKDSFFKLSISHNDFLRISSRFEDFAFEFHSAWYNSCKKDIEYVFYGGCSIINCSPKLKKKYPCGLGDFFKYQTEKTHYPYKIFREIFKIWGEQYPIWRDFCNDFEHGSAYASIPLSTIFLCNTRRELIEKMYGKSLKRNNRETIGKGILLAKLENIVEPDEVQKLYNFDFSENYFIRRTKGSLAHPLSVFLYKTLNFKDPTEYDKEDFISVFGENYICDIIEMNSLLKRKMLLNFKSIDDIIRLHDRLAEETTYTTSIPIVKIPKNSVFSTLKLPADCIRLTMRKQFIEEGKKQHNCVMSYIKAVNQDRSSIWSMRKDDGTRYTIEIRHRKCKSKPEGTFYIAQMLGFANTKANMEDYERVSSFIKK